MKKTMLIVTVIILILCGCVFAACSKTDSNNLGLIKEYMSAASEASRIEQEISVSSGDTLLSSEKKVYNVNDNVISGTVTLKTLNPDITASELYLESTSPFSFSVEEESDNLPVAFAVDENYFKDGKFDLTATEISFYVAAASAGKYLGLTDAEAASIASDIFVKATILDKKVTAVRAEYATSNGNSVYISTAYTY